MWFWIAVTLIILTIIARRAWSNNRQQLIWAGIQLMAKLMKAQQAGDTCKVHGTYAEISYTYEGKSYNLYVPFYKRKVIKGLNKQVTLIIDGRAMDITQQPGIPYFCSPRALGGSRIDILDTETGTNLTVDEVTVPNLYG